MNCPKCKRNIEQSSRYCNYCGTNISDYKRKKTNIGISTLESMKTYLELTKPRTNSKQIYLSNSKKQIQQPQPQIQYTYQIPNSHQAQYNYSNTYSGVQQQRVNTHQAQYNYSNAYSRTQPRVNTHQTQYNYSNSYSGVQQQTGNTHQDQYNYSSNYNRATKNTYIASDDDYIKIYIGERYNEIINSKFSIPTLLFGGFYLIYRKLWIYAIVWFIIVTMTAFSPIIIIFINIFIATNFAKLYLYYAKLEVSNIKTKNHDKSGTEIAEICRKKGGVIHKVGVTITNIVTILPIITIISLIAFFIIYIENVTEKPIENNIEKENLLFTIPTGYTENYNYRYSKLYSSNNNCEIKIEKKISDDTNIKTYMYENAIDPNSQETIKERQINSNTWYYLQNTFPYYHYQYLGIATENEKYLITFSYPIESKNICEIEALSFMNTLKFENDNTNNYEYN